MNKIREHKEEEELQEAKNSWRTRFAAYLGLKDKADLNTIMPFILFLSALALVYIYNSHQAIKVVRQSDALVKEIKEHRAEYISIKSKLMYDSKQSQVARKVEHLGLKELTQPPKKISYDPDELE